MKGNRRMDTAVKTGFLFTAPTMLYMLMFIGYPMIQNVIPSSKNMDVYTFSSATEQNLMGFRNYNELFTGKNSILSKTVLSTPTFTICSIFSQFMIEFDLALLFNERFPRCSFFRGVTMISWLLPMTVAGPLFKFIFTSSSGIINQLFTGLGLVKQPLNWLLKPELAMVMIVAANIWIGTPFSMMPLITDLTITPGDIYESASLGGISRLQALFLVAISMTKPAIMSMFTLGFVYTSKAFDLVWVTTKGESVNSTGLVFTYAYHLSFEGFQLSQSAVVISVLFMILLTAGCFYTKMISDSEVM